MAFSLSAFGSLVALLATPPAASFRVASDHIDMDVEPDGVDPDVGTPSSDDDDDSPAAREAALATWAAPAEVRHMSLAQLQSFDGSLLAECFALNGNGFDWSSTLAFLAEALEVRAKEADDIVASSGKEVLLYHDCVVGGSSGSASVGVYHSLLRNEELWKSFGAPPTVVHNLALGSGVTLPTVKLYSPHQTHVLSRAMRFLAMGVDFARDELALFLPYYIGGSNARSCEASSMKWWTQCINPMAIKTLFAEHALAARYLTLSDFDGVGVEDAVRRSHVCYRSLFGRPCRRKLKTVASNNGVGSAIDSLVSRGTRDTDPEFQDKLLLFRAQNKWAMRGHHQINRRVYSNSRAWYSRRLIRPSITKDTPLNHMLNETLTDAYATSCFVVLFNSEEELMAHADTPPLYSDTRTAFITTENTAKLILASEHFQQDVRDPEARTRNILILVVETYFEAFNMAIREPYMLPVLSGKLSNIGVSKVYDPQRDLQTGPVMRFELQDVTAGAGGELALAVLGGYPNANIMAHPQAYLVESLQRGFTQAAPRARLVQTQHNRFLKSVTALFARRVIRDLLSGDSLAEEHLSDFEAFGANYEEVWLPRFASMGIKANRARMNWGLENATFGLPRAAARESYLIIPRSHQAVRDQMDSQRDYGQRLFPEDNMDAERNYFIKVAEDGGVIDESIGEGDSSL